MNYKRLLFCRGYAIYHSGPWYPPLGTGNMLQVLRMGLHVCQLMGYEQIRLNLITGNGARTLNLSEYGIKCGYQANLLILPAENGFDAVRRQPPPHYVIRRGRVIAQTQPSQSMLCLQEPESVNFR